MAPCKHKCHDKASCKHACCKAHAAAEPSRSSYSLDRVFDRIPDVLNPRRHGGVPRGGAYLHERAGAAQVMGIAELVLTILKYLSPGELLGFKRVNTYYARLLSDASMRYTLFRPALPALVGGAATSNAVPDSSNPNEAATDEDTDKDNDDAESSGASSFSSFDSSNLNDRDPGFSRVKHMERPVETRRINDALFRVHPGEFRTRPIDENTLTLQLLNDPLLATDDNAHLETFITQPPTELATFDCHTLQRHPATPTSAARTSTDSVIISIWKRQGITYDNIVMGAKRAAQILRDRNGGAPGRVEIDLNLTYIEIQHTNTRAEAVVPEPHWILEWRERLRQATNGHSE